MGLDWEDNNERHEKHGRVGRWEMGDRSSEMGDRMSEMGDRSWEMGYRIWEDGRWFGKGTTKGTDRHGMGVRGLLGQDWDDKGRRA